MDEKEIWNKLKTEVLTTSGIESIEPKDCKMLTLLIFKRTKKQISETTLKRVFGFASAQFEASLHTKNTLSQFCGYADWEGYGQLTLAKLATAQRKTSTWYKLNEEVNKVNFFMLSAVKNKAIIPFTKMIRRDSFILISISLMKVTHWRRYLLPQRAMERL